MQLKKFIALAVSAITLSFLCVPILKAADAPTPDYLAIIAKNTSDILEKVNSMPAYLEAMTTYILNWQKEDDSAATAQMQLTFNSIVKADALNVTTQKSKQAQITADMLGIPIADLTMPKENPKILAALPKVNNLSYATLLGIPPVPKGEALPYEYIKNAAGLSIIHDIPVAGWSGGKPAKDRYQGFINAILAVESYDAYLLSGLWAEIENGNILTKAQNELLQTASDSNWLMKVASEELGKVLRQTLLFQSQSYVLLTQSLQVQKQQLAATAMTNTLLILNAQTNESLMSGRAQGTMP